MSITLRSKSPLNILTCDPPFVKFWPRLSLAWTVNTTIFCPSEIKLFGVIERIDLSDETGPETVAQGTLWVGDYLCPKCDADRIFVVLMQTRSSDEPETKICTCESCGHKFREYQ